MKKTADAQVNRLGRRQSWALALALALASARESHWRRAQTMTGMAGRHRFVVVASRLPVDRTEGPDGEAEWRPSPGGLVSALEPVMRESGGVWIGWSGDAGPAPGPFTANDLDLVGIGLSADQVRDYYEGFCNATLWPLYHDVIAPPSSIAGGGTRT